MTSAALLEYWRGDNLGMPNYYYKPEADVELKKGGTVANFKD